MKVQLWNKLWFCWIEYWYACGKHEIRNM